MEGVGLLSDISALPGQQKSQRNLPRKGEHVQGTEAVLASRTSVEAGRKCCSGNAFSGNKVPGDTLLLVMNKDAVNAPTPPEQQTGEWSQGCSQAGGADGQC